MPHARFLPVALLALALPGSRPAVAASEPTAAELQQGKVRTGRFIELALVVDGTPEELFEDWIRSARADRFFGSASRIEPRVGGLYEISFGRRPDGGVAGTRGTRILRFEPGRALDFEWQMPYFADELNARPLPTWVEIRFTTHGESPPRTLVHVQHEGFGSGELWDRCFSFFQRGWFEILFRLTLRRAFFPW